MLTALILAALLSVAANHFDSPDPERWRLSERDAIAGRCEKGTRDGTMACEYQPRGLWRRVRNFRASRRRDKTYLYVESVPLFCSWSQVRPLARAQLQSRDSTPAPRLETPDPYSLVLRSQGLHAAYVARGDELVFVELRVPSGLSERDRSDFERLVGSVRPVELPSAYRRGRWLRIHADSRDARDLVAVCGIDVPARMKLAESLLRRATHERPDRFEPWAELALNLDALGGGRDVLGELLALEPAPPLDRGEIRMKPARTVRPLDVARLREAAEAYLDALERHPPEKPEPGRTTSSRDRATLFARVANVYVRLGERVRARSFYRSALAVGEIPSWGRLEAALWLAEDACVSGDRMQAAELFRITGRTAVALESDDPVRLVPLPRVRSVVDRRLAELER